jgi:phage gp29-like protein
MNLFGYRLPFSFKEEPKKKVRSLGGELGATGTRSYLGIIDEEYNQDLHGLEGYEVYDKMRKSDGTVQAALLAVKLPVQRAHWYVRPASDSPEDIERARFIEWNLFQGMTVTWDEFLRQSLLMLDFGNMVFEKVFEVKQFEGKEMVTWRKFGPRLPRTIHAWQMENGANGIQQRLIDGRNISIPMEKLIIFVHEKEGDNWGGKSILRAAYKHWYYKDKFYLIDAMAFEKHGLGVPMATHLIGASEEDKRATEKVLQNMRANHQQYIIKPEGMELEFMDMKANSLRDPETSIGHHNREITKSVLAQFLELGATASGSRSLSEDQSTVFLQSLESVANNNKETINRHAVKQLIDMNWENVEEYPTLEYTGISKTDVQQVATAYKTLVEAGAIINDDEDERYFRELLNLPEREIKEGEDRNAEPEKDDEDENLEEMGMSEHTCGKKKSLSPHSYAEPGELKPWRALTFAETKVNYKTLQNEIDRLEASFLTEATSVLTAARTRYMKSMVTALNTGNTKTAETLQFKAAGTYAAVLREHEREAFTYGKNSAAREMKVAAPGTPSQTRAAMNMQAHAIAAKQTAAIEASTKLAAAEVLTKGGTIAAAVAAADLAADKAITKLVRDTTAVVMSGYINHGRNHTFETYKDKIYALQRSEILDKNTCNYCLSVDGRVLEKTDPFTKNTVFHSGCRGIWVEILLDETEKPPIRGLPKDLRDRFGDAVNELIQPRTPKNLKSALAQKEIQKRK